MLASSWSAWKDILRPGHFVASDVLGRLRHYDFTPADLSQIASTGKKLIQAGWTTPLCWEHRNVEPERNQVRNTARDISRGVFGHIADYDFTPDGRLKALLKGKDRKDHEKFARWRFVSPEIAWTWRDSTGHDWRGPMVTHLAATPTPVQSLQYPFGTNPDNGAVVNTHSKSLETIAKALRVYCGIDLGNVKDCDPDRFAKLVEVATRSYGQRRRKQKMLAARMSHPTSTRKSEFLTTDEVVAAFFRHTGSNYSASATESRPSTRPMVG